MEAQLAAIAKFCAENEGSFALGVGQKGGFSAMLNFGREAPDSPMAGGSAIGMGDTAAEAVAQVVAELKLEVDGPKTAADVVDEVIEAYLVKCGECGFIGGPDAGQCMKCGYDGGFTPDEAQNTGGKWVKVSD